MIDKKDIEELINKCTIQADTLLKVMQHPESTEDEITRTSIARRFVVGFKNDLKALTIHSVTQRSELLFCKCGSVKNGGYGCMRTDCDNTLLAFMQNNCG